MTNKHQDTPNHEGKTFVFSHYGPAPTLVFRNSNLSLGAKGVYGYLVTYISIDQTKNGQAQAWPSRKRILKGLNISSNTLSKYLNELKEAGFLKIDQGRRKLEEGKQVYGNNLYTLQTYIEDPSPGETDLDTKQETDLIKQPSPNSNSSNSAALKTSSPQEVITSTTMPLSSTKKISNTISDHPKTASKSEGQSHDGLAQSLKAGEMGDLPISLDELITFWNDQEVNIHQKIGVKTKERLALALKEALEDYSLDDLLGSISNYGKIFQAQKAKHKYRLVEFFEKKGYEHFLHAGNWQGREERKFRREDFTYTMPKQDLSSFSWIDDEVEEGLEHGTLAFEA